MRTFGLFIKIAVPLLVVFCVTLSIAQEHSGSLPPSAAASTAASAEPQKVFVFVQRTDRHAKYSSPEVFHNLLDDLLDYLKTKNVAIAVDEFGGRNHAEGATPLDTIFAIARDAKASGVMYVVVDRPVTKWLKITVQCFDMSQKQLWQEEASSGGGLSGSHGFEVSTKKLHAQLDKRVGQAGLPIVATAQPDVAEKQ
jgi:biopolymer transport protein ExbD